MADQRIIAVSENERMDLLLNRAAQFLQSQGFFVLVTTMSDTVGTLKVSRDRDGFKNFMGLGIESNATIMRNGSTLSISVEHDWTNKIIAVAVGWFLCWIPIITGIIGAVDQSGMTDKIYNALIASANQG